MKHASAALVHALYHQLISASGTPAAHFQRWRAHWEHVHGPPGRKRHVDTTRLAAQYGLAPALDIPTLLYAVEACFVLRMRLLASQALGVSLPPGPDPAGARETIARLFSGQHFAALGIANYDADLFDFTVLPLDTHTLDLLAAELAPAAQQRAPASVRQSANLAISNLQSALAPGDALRTAYHRLLPKQVRHALGAFFTPPWLAAYVVEAVHALLPSPLHARLIDPACGAGTFLLAALEAHVAAARTHGIGGVELLQSTMARVAGLDINPVAVQAAKTNVLLFMAALARHEQVALPTRLQLPVELHDALAPEHPLPGSLAAEHLPPAFDPPFDAVIGNPPWVNWEYLPPAERARTQHLWAELGLFELRGTQKAFSKEDVAGLFTYAAARRFLAAGGLLGFVLPQSLFKSTLNGRGFRRMHLGAAGPPLGVLAVDDLVALRPFEGASGRPAMLLLRKGEPTTPPIPYRRWRLPGSRAVPEAWDWPTVHRAVTIDHGQATPTDPTDTASPWTDASLPETHILARLAGPCAYRARAGMFTGGANGVYYVNLIEQAVDGMLLVRNLNSGARRAVPTVEAWIEPEFVFPLLRGREMEHWHAAGTSFVLCPHTALSRMAAVAPETLRAQAPRTYAYLEQFHSALAERRGFAGWERRFQQEAFYAVQRIGAYTFAPYKLVWRYIAPEFRCAVVGPAPVGSHATRPVIPHEKLIIIPFEEPDEAFFVCGVLSSGAARRFIHSRMVETQIAPGVIANLAIPRYDAANEQHRTIASVCRAGHARRAAGDTAGVRATHQQLDALMPGVLPLSAEEVRLLAAIDL
jgi:hypothetical protein